MKYFKCHIQYYNRHIKYYKHHMKFFGKPLLYLTKTQIVMNVEWALEPTMQLAGKKTLLCQSNSLGPTISNSGKIDVRTFTSVKDFLEAWSTGSPWRRRSMCPRELCWDRSLRGWRVGRIQDRTQWPDAKTSQPHILDPLESTQVCNFTHKSDHHGCLKGHLKCARRKPSLALPWT